MRVRGACDALDASKITVIHTVMMMNDSILTTAAALPDRELLLRLHELAGRERVALVELLAHLAELDVRRSLFVAEGYASLFAYCTGALGLSGDAAFNRIEAARACRRFPVILDLLADGAVTLTAVKMIARHLTPENHAEVLAAARRRTKPEIEALVARLAPKPDSPTVIRKLAERASPSAADSGTPETPPGSAPASPAPPPNDEPAPSAPSAAPLAARPAARPVIRASAPARFLVQLTVGQDTHDRFRRLQSLYARECRGGDPVEVFDLACLALEEKGLKTKRAEAKNPRKRVGAKAPPRAHGRHVPAAVSRAVWNRDGHRCTFVGRNGVRCGERKYLELHHVIPWALGGPTSVGNLSVRCRVHNAHEAERDFGVASTRRSSSGRTPADHGKASAPPDP